ncbi:MAG: AMP-binding protein [Actinomycetota bacterium]|nr:AMP-binding protein [Actinomycetota bacterium]
MADEHASRRAAIDGWGPIAEQLAWATPWTELFRDHPPYHDWFLGGELNLAANCTDRHLPDRADQVAIWWEGEPGERRALTFAELHAQVVALAAGLKRLGLGRGDRVALHLGWLPETVVSLLAAIRLGAEVTVIPVALPGEALSSRLADFRPRVLFTQDGGWRRGTILPLKARADEAIEAASGIQNTIVLRRTGVHVDWFEGDLWYDEVVGDGAQDDAEPEPLPAQHPVVAVYVANRRGRPVAIRLGAANLAAVALANHRYAMCEGDVFWGAADVSWLGAQTHGIFGPLLAGTSSVMYEGTLDYPDPARFWQLIERYSVTSLVTSPSIVRALRGWSLQAPGGSASLRRVVTIGDRLEPDLREWLAGALGDRVTLADGWGQMELGGIVAYDLPHPPPMLPDPGFAILDENGEPVPDGSPGEWVMVHPWVGVMRGVEAGDGDPTSHHWERFPGRYATGDLARRNGQGDVEFLGRVDEVISVSGQLVSLTEVRDILRDQPFVRWAEAFERIDARLGRSVAAAVVLEPGAPDDAATLRELQDSVRELLGGLSRPRALLILDRVADDVSDPLLRRSLAAIAAAAGSEPLSVTWEQVRAAASA